jgi:hypothetical protein
MTMSASASVSIQAIDISGVTISSTLHRKILDSAPRNPDSHQAAMEVRFSGATFQGDAYFNGTTFQANAHFNGVTWEQRQVIAEADRYDTGRGCCLCSNPPSRSPTTR